MKKILILMIAAGSLLMAACKNKGNGFDTNPAEIADGDENRKNSQTNAEANMDTTRELPAPRDTARGIAPDTKNKSK